MTERALIRPDLERATPSQTIETFQAAADMFLAGKQLAFKHLTNPPYIPSVIELTEHTSGAIPDLHSLTDWQRSFLTVDGLMQTYSIMNNRADYQTRYEQHPDVTAHHLLSALRRATDGKVDLEVKDVNFKWSLFSLALVAKKDAFEIARRYYLGNKPAVGFVSTFATELGRMPIVLKEKQAKSTIWHENIHIWQEHMGLDNVAFNFGYEVDNPAVMRAVDNENIQPADLKECLSFLNGVFTLARREMAIEVPAYLWSEEKPIINMLESGKYPQIYFSLVNLLNVIYSPNLNFDEGKQIKEHYDVLMRIYKVDLMRQRMYAISVQAMQDYEGDYKRWEYAASRATVLPPDCSIEFFRSVMLGKENKLKEEPKLNHPATLAMVLLTHVRRCVHPEPYGQGGEIPKELLDTFYASCIDIFKKPNLYQQILDNFNFSREDIEKTIQYFIILAGKSVPQGVRGKTKKILKESITPQLL